jgi:phage baseplate assembly protein gpV
VSFGLINGVMSQALRGSKIRGVQLATVVDNKDGEGNPGFRVKLKFSWLNEQESTFWARIALPMAGPDRGTYVLPEIDDQVLVVFEHGNINRPIVIGALWSKQQEPVEVNQSGKNNTKLIKSRSGHRIIFDDKDGAEKITIVDKTKKNKIVLDSVNKIVKIESDGDIEVIAKTNVVMHSNALKIGTKEGVTGKGKSLLVHSAKTFGLKATSGITIGGGNTTINTSNAAACSVSGSGAGELGGAAAEKPKEQLEEKKRGGGAGVGGGTQSTAARAQPQQPEEDQKPAQEEPENKLVLVAWSTNTCDPDDEVQMQLTSEGHPKGTAVQIQLKTRDGDELVETLNKQLAGDSTSLPWKYHHDTHGGDDQRDRPSDQLPDYYFEATVASETKKSGILSVRTTLKIAVKDKRGRPVRYARFQAKLVGGRTVEGELDGEPRVESRECSATGGHCSRFAEERCCRRQQHSAERRAGPHGRTFSHRPKNCDN